MRALAIGATVAFALSMNAYAQQAQSTAPPAAPAQAPKPAADAKDSIAGKWSVSVDTDNGSYPSTLEIKLDAGKVAGTMTSEMGTTDVKGEFADGKLTFAMTLDMQGNSLQINFEGKLQENGTFAGTATADQLGQMAWRAERVK